MNDIERETQQTSSNLMTDRSDHNLVHLLWTGGWDSTFRLLQLLTQTDAHVQPIYLVDETRDSLLREIDTMKTLRREIVGTLPNADRRLSPTRYGGSFQAITIEPHHRRQWEALKEEARVGYQYPKLASYAEQNDLERLEIGARASGFRDQLESHFETRTTPGGPVTVLAEGVSGPAALFERFAFPLLSLPKQEMKAEAERMGLLSIMEKTWFCHTPVLGLPCGRCYPCTTVIDEGMDHRIGHLGPLLATVRQSIIYARAQVRA